MKNKIIMLCLISLCVSLNIVSQPRGIRRFAVVVGANDGGRYRTPLRFAVSDAASFMKVLKNMGSVYSDDAYLLYQPNRENLIAVLNDVYSKIVKVKRDYEKIEFVFYYSGHSDEDGLLLSSDSVSYLELKKTIEAIPADVRIAILDSCYSGSFTQMKGGRKRPPFMLDTAYNMKGNAFMTSSSRDEVSQESERIKGSFFTHYLVLGLRGAADVTQDKKITLNEAYQFAYRETLVRTEKTLGGAQHPNYHIQMTGTGDVVLTDISKGSAKLQFDENVEGRISIFTKENILMAEFSKVYGQSVLLSLDPGEYLVSFSNSKGLNEAKVALKEETKNLALNDFSKTERELTAMRGGIEIFPEDNSAGRKTLLSDSSIRISGYGAFIVKYGPPHLGNNQVYAGGKACILINDVFGIGGGGFGLTYPTKRKKSVYNQADYSPESSYNYPEIQFGYGGGIIEYYFMTKSLFTFSGGLLIGGGALIMERESDADTAQPENPMSKFFVLEPELSAYVNVARLLRVGFSVSYRFTNGVDLHEYRDHDFMGVFFSFNVCGGWF
ncbi:MAG TPA: caspase family protein [Spirochaetota bacterium]|nr:caspase family protein [Spirochaetota bacterium]HQQ24386.1 caspase family protein [Spirochaetota bacterium]